MSIIKRTIPIKFRGKSKETEEFVYGDLIHKKKKVFIINVEDDKEVEVLPSSICQLVGYDADHKEMYETDHIIIYRAFLVGGEELRKKFKPCGKAKIEYMRAGDSKFLEDNVDSPFDYSFLLDKK